MDIKDFIKESLLQIVDGITEANTALEAKAGFGREEENGEMVVWRTRNLSCNAI